MTTMQIAKLSGLWEFYGTVANKCPAIYVLTSWEEMKHAYLSGDCFESGLEILHQAAYDRSMDSCEISNSQYRDHVEDCQFSNEAEIDTIANELASVLGHSNF